MQQKTKRHVIYVSEKCNVCVGVWMHILKANYVVYLN